MSLTFGPRGYALESVELNVDDQFVFTREDGSVRPPALSVEEAVMNSADCRAIVFNLVF